MSSFIVSKKTMDRIGTFLYAHKSDFGASEISKELSKLKVGSPDELGNLFYQMNRDAVGQRYSEGSPSFDYKYTEEPTTIKQVIMHLHCLRYQSSEGNVTETKTFKALTKIIQILEAEFTWKEVKNLEWDA